MPTIQTCDVQATGGDETTIAAALTNIATYVTGLGLVANDEIYRIRVEAGTYAETLTINTGVTADATRRIEIVPQAGAEHDGTAGSGVIIQPTAGSGATATILDEFTMLKDIEVRPEASSGRSAIEVGNSSNNGRGVRLDGLLLYGHGNSSFTSDGVRAQEWNLGTAADPVLVINCVIWGFDRAGIFAQNSRSWADLDQYIDSVNNDFYDNGRHIGYRVARATSSFVTRVVNCTGANHLTGDFDTIGVTSGVVTTTGSANNFSENGTAGTAFPGTDGVDWALVTAVSATANQIGVTASGGTDEINFNALKLAGANNDILDEGVGTTNSLVPVVDMFGTARPVLLCDPGATQVTVAASPIEPTGVASTTGMGSPSLVGNIDATGIVPTDSQVGVPGLVGNVESTGVSSATAVGALSVTGNVEPAGISSTTAVGAPSAIAGTGTIEPTGVVSTSAVGAPTLAGNVEPVGMSSTTAVGAPTLAGNMEPAGISSTTAVGAPSVTGNVESVGISSTTAVGAPTLVAGAGIIAPGGIASTTAVGLPLIWPDDMPVAYRPVSPTQPTGAINYVASGALSLSSGDGNQTYILTGNVGEITIDYNAQTVAIYGNGYTCDLITINSQFAGPGIAQDIYIENLTCVNSAAGSDSAVDIPVGAHRVHLKNIACDRADISAYGLWVSGDDGAITADDIFAENCAFDTDGTQAAQRTVTVVRCASIGGSRGTPSKHGLRLHGISSYVWWSDITVVAPLYLGYQDSHGAPYDVLDEFQVHRIDHSTNDTVNESWFQHIETLGTLTNFVMTGCVGPGVIGSRSTWDSFSSQANRTNQFISGNTQAGALGVAIPDIDAGGIASTAAVGSPTVAGGTAIAPTGIASTVALGVPQLDGYIAPTGTASATAMGAPSAVGNVAVTGVASVAAVGEPSLSGSAAIAPAGIATTTAAGSPEIVGAIALAGIASTTATGVPTIAGPTTIAPGGVASTTAVGGPQLNGTVALGGLASTSAVGTPAVVYVLTPDGIASAAVFGTVTVAGVDVIVPSGIASVTALGAPTVVGDGTIAPDGVSSTTDVGAPALVDPGLTVTLGVLGAETTTLRVAAETTTLQVHAATTDDSVGVSP